MTRETLDKAKDLENKIQGFKTAENKIEEFVKKYEEARRGINPDKLNKLKEVIISDEKGNTLKFTGDEIDLSKLIKLRQMIEDTRILAEHYKKELEKL